MTSNRDLYKPEITAPKEICSFLQSKGIRFKIFDLIVEGEYATEDAEFNFADCPHHEHVHNVMEDKTLLVTESGCSELRIQSITPLIKIPVLSVGYKFAKNRFLTSL